MPKTLKTYEAMEFVYKQRRAEAWRKDDRTSVRKLTIKINRTRQTIRHRRERNKRIGYIDRLVMLYLDTPSVKNSGRGKDMSLALSKKLFCKYALENGEKGIWLERYMGYAETGTVAAGHRMRFTKSFRTKPENKNIWLNFLKHAESLNCK